MRRRHTMCSLVTGVLTCALPICMATNIPPHNLGEVIRAVLAYIDNTGITIDELIQIVPGPDFPTAPLILGQSGARSAYHTGRGSIMMRARHEIEEEIGRAHV